MLLFFIIHEGGREIKAGEEGFPEGNGPFGRFRAFQDRISVVEYAQNDTSRGGLRSPARAAERAGMKTPSTQSTIYIGLNDSETGVQKFGTERYLTVLKNVCKSYHVAFSVQVIAGGYFHEDGRYTEENTLTLTLMEVPEETVLEIAKDLCAFFHQESVMVTSSPSTVVFVREAL